MPHSSFEQDMCGIENSVSEREILRKCPIMLEFLSKKDIFSDFLTNLSLNSFENALKIVLAFLT